jgi:hypothetical protein
VRDDPVEGRPWMNSKKMDNGRIWGSWAMGELYTKMDLQVNWETSCIIQFGEIGQFMNTLKIYYYNYSTFHLKAMHVC